MTAIAMPSALLTFNDVRSANPTTTRPAEIGATENAPLWLESALRAASALGGLPADWDSYGARPIHASVIAATADLLRQVVEASTPAPTIVPTSKGGIQIEWHTVGGDLEIEIASPGRISYLFEDRATGVEDEQELKSDLSPLAGAVAKLIVRR